MAILNTPRFRIVALDGTGKETELEEVQATQADVVRYDMLRRKYSWPDIKEAPVLWGTVVAWSALVRIGFDISAQFDEALPRILDVTMLNRDGEPVEGDADDVGVNPTRGRA